MIVGIDISKNSFDALRDRLGLQRSDSVTVVPALAMTCLATNKLAQSSESFQSWRLSHCCGWMTGVRTGQSIR